MFRNAATARDQVVVRYSTPADAPALDRLAALDSSRPLRGPALIAEADSRPLAALPLGSGRPIADPFEPTAELIALLELRAAQLRAQEGSPRRGPLRRMRSLIRPRPAQASG